MAGPAPPGAAGQALIGDPLNIGRFVAPTLGDMHHRMMDMVVAENSPDHLPLNSILTKDDCVEVEFHS